MAIDQAFRRRAVRSLTNEVGCYVLCDLDQVPIYVGQSVDGIRSRVNRHLTSARSQIALCPFGHKSLMRAFMRFEADATLVAAIGLDCGAEMIRLYRGIWFAQAYQ